MMFCRHKFVTNSSSSSFLIYGIELTREQSETLINLTIAINIKEIEKKLHEYYDEDEDNMLNIEDIMDLIAGKDVEFLDDFFPAGAGLRRCGETDTYWIGFDNSLTAEIQDGKVVLVDFPADEVAKAIELAKDAGVENPRLEAIHWAEYD